MTEYVPITLHTSVLAIEPTAFVASPPGSPWLGFPYRWTVNLEVVAQNHSIPFTRQPFAYTGQDVVVGDWLVFNLFSIAVQIKSISSQKAQTLSLSAQVLSTGKPGSSASIVRPTRFARVEPKP